MGAGADHTGAAGQSPKSSQVFDSVMNSIMALGTNSIFLHECLCEKLSIEQVAILVHYLRKDVVLFVQESDSKMSKGSTKSNLFAKKMEWLCILLDILLIKMQVASGSRVG